MLSIGIVGGTGRLGRQIIELILESDHLSIGAVITRKGNEYAGTDIGGLVGDGDIGQLVVDDISSTSCDIYIDCTNQTGLRDNISQYYQIKKPVIIATTGYDTTTADKIEILSRVSPVLICPNFSIGVYKFLKIISHAAKELSDLGADIQVIEAHHKMKKDKPSGTAKAIVDSIIKEQPNSIENMEVHSIRAGNIVGEHTVMFVTDQDERIELSHRIYSRKGFAQGVLKAIAWISNKDNGLYNIEDVFGNRTES